MKKFVRAYLKDLRENPLKYFVMILLGSFTFGIVRFNTDSIFLIYGLSICIIVFIALVVDGIWSMLSKYFTRNI